MRKGDYKSIQQAQEYESKRFSGGLALVAKDEAKVINNFLTKIHSPNPVFLDLGSGTGRVVGELVKYKPKTIYALDPSTTMLTVLRRKFTKEIERNTLKLLIAKSNNIPLKNQSINVVTSLHLLKHLEDITPTINEAYRVINNNGFFIFDVLNRNSIINLNLGTCYALSEQEIRTVLKKCRFRIIDIAFLHFLGETVYDLGGEGAHKLDALVSKLGIKLGTKMFVLAQKNA